MAKSREIIYAAMQSTRRSPRWWILALIQVMALFGIARLARPEQPRTLPLFLLILSVIVLQPATTWLWFEIEADYAKQVKQIAVKIFIRQCFITGGMTLCAVAVMFLGRLIYPNWVFLTFLSSFTAATCALAMLYVVICRQNFGSAWALAFDTWHKKVSLGVAAAFVLIIIHGISFALAHEIRISIGLFQQFSVFSYFATMGVLLAVMIVAVAVLAAFLNCCLVFLFLEIIRRQKDAEFRQAAIKELAVPQANP